MFTQIACRARQDNVTHIIAPIACNRDYMLNMIGVFNMPIFANALKFKMTIIALMSLPYQLILNILNGICSTRPLFERITRMLSNQSSLIVLFSINCISLSPSSRNFSLSWPTLESKMGILTRFASRIQSISKRPGSIEKFWCRRVYLMASNTLSKWFGFNKFSLHSIVSDTLFTQTLIVLAIKVKAVKRFDALTFTATFVSFWAKWLRVLFFPFSMFALTTMRIQTSSRWFMRMKVLKSSGFQYFALGTPFVSIWNNLLGLSCGNARLTIVQKPVTHSSVPLKKLRGGRKSLAAFAALFQMGILGYSITHGKAPFLIITPLADCSLRRGNMHFYTPHYTTKSLPKLV